MDAKDLYLANYSNEYCCWYSVNYKSGEHRGEINTRKFVNTLDYSKDLIKLAEVYERAYRRLNFTQNIHGKEYCRSVINVTFKYSVKEFNRFPNNIYVRFGYTMDDITIRDCICTIDGQLAAIQTGCPVENAISQELLGDYFCLEDGVYKTTGKTIKSLQTVAQLREKLYTDGFKCDGIKYIRFKRSSGSSRVGKCLFIDERLYNRMHRWELCGLKVKEGQEIDLAALEAYISLTLSSIIGLVSIQPENFLVIDDYESVFQDRAVAVRVGDDGWLSSKEEEISVKNSIWDGQSLIDRSLLGEYQDKGMVLLRNRFFKSACFNCNLQQFFADHGITDVSQLNGRTIATDIRDIKIITTPSSIKYLKFGTLEKWLEELYEEPDFGVVKYEKPTHFFHGDMVQIHYQLLNTLQMSQEEVNELVKPSLDYLRLIQNDPAVMRYYIKYSGDSQELTSASTVNDVVYQMIGLTDKFTKTKLYYDFLHDVTKSYKKSLRVGHILVDGNYSTLLGNPVEMLLASIGRFDGTSQIGVGNIYSTAFEFDTKMLGSRSPHVTMGNVWLTHNQDNEMIRRYLNVTKNIVCINSIGENILMRLSGADFDSDTSLLTNNELLIRAAQRNYDRFCVPTSLVEAKKVVRTYSRKDQADLDIKTSVNKIGEIVNLSQELNTMLWDRLNRGESYEDVAELYYDIAKLDVLSGIEIDKAKKEFSIDSVAEIKRLRSKYAVLDDDGRQVKPNFFGCVARQKGYYDSKKKNYKFHRTTMDFIQHTVNSYYNQYGGIRSDKKCLTKSEKKHYVRKFLPFSSLLCDKPSKMMSNSRYVDRIIDITRRMRNDIGEVWTSKNDSLTNEEKMVLVSDIRQQYHDYIKNITLNKATAYQLLLEIENPRCKDISNSLFYILFSIPNDNFLSLLNQQRTPVGIVEQDPYGEIEIFGNLYAHFPIL